MRLGFNDYTKDAHVEAICQIAGELFKAQVNYDQQTDYTEEKAFNDAIYYLAKKAKDRGFYCLYNKSVESVASLMGDYISNYLEHEKRFPR